MESKLVTKKFLSTYKSCFFNTGVESTMFHDEKYLLKFIKPEYLKDDRETIIKRLPQLSHEGLVTPEFLLHDRKGFLGYAMKLYSDYVTLDSLTTNTIFSDNKDCPFEERKKIILKLYEILNYLKKNNFAFYDIHGGNIITKNGDVKLIDLDSGVFKGTTNAKISYQAAYIHSIKQFALYALAFLYNCEWMKFQQVFNSPSSSLCQSKKEMYKHLPESLQEFYAYALGNDYYVFNDMIECLDKIDESVYQESLQVLKKRP